MGGLVRALTGGSKSVSKNTNKNLVNGIFTSGAQTGSGAIDMLGSLLGLGGDSAAAQSGMNNFMNSTGYDFLKKEGQRAVVGNHAAQGLLNSGSAGRALVGFNNNLAKTATLDFMDRLGNLGQLGLGAGGLLANVGQKSKGTSYSGIMNSLFPGGIGGG